jgi:hypothetical protein
MSERDPADPDDRFVWHRDDLEFTYPDELDDAPAEVDAPEQAG